MRIIRALFAAGSISALFVTGSANATVYCEVATGIGVEPAMRREPSDSAGLVMRLRPGAQVQLGRNETADWVEVLFWAGDGSELGSHAEVGRKVARGWLHRRFIVPDSCG